MKYEDIVKSDFIPEYKIMHRILCNEINRLIFSCAFLKCAYNANFDMLELESSDVISYLYKNEFELFILRIYRNFFDDNGSQTVTLNKFSNIIIKNCINDEIKKSICFRIKESQWRSYEITALQKKLEYCINEFRDKLIAHSLSKEIKDVTVSLLELEKILDAGIDLFNMLSFEVDDFYIGVIEKSALKFDKEKETTMEMCRKYFLYHWLSSNAIKSINCDYMLFTNQDHKEKLESALLEINTKHTKYCK